MDESTPQQKSKSQKPRLGVLFVHGIGEQRRADSLVQWTDKLCYWLTRYSLDGQRPVFESVTVTRAAITDHRDARDAHEDPAYVKLTLEVDSFLKPPFRAWEVDHAAAEHDWILAEGYWADIVRAPSFVSMLQWVFQILPWTLLTHGDRLMRRLLASRRPQGWDALVTGVLGALRVLLTAVLVLPLTALLALLLILIVLLRAIPVSAAQTISVAIQKTLAASVGDSMILLSSPIRRAAILDRVHHAYRWLEEQGCTEIAVVAHSQGAAIAHELLRERSCPKARLLVTFGSGLQKLKEISKAMEQGSSSLWWGSLSAIAIIPVIYLLFTTSGAGALQFLVAELSFGIFVTLATLLLLRSLYSNVAKNVPSEPVGLATAIVLGIAAVSGYAVSYFAASGLGLALFALGTVALMYWLYPGGGLLFFLFAGLLAILLFFVVKSIYGRAVQAVTEHLRRRQDAFPSEYQLPRHVARWVDVYARSDPVPNGPLLLDMPSDESVLTSVEIENHSSPLFDHTTYWTNFEQFVSRVAQELLRIARFDLQVVASDSDLQRLIVVRTERVRVLKKARLLLVLSALLLALSWWPAITVLVESSVPTLSAHVAKLPVVGSAVAAALDTHRNSGALAFLSVLLITVAALIALALLEALWAIWSGVAGRRIDRKEPEKPSGTEKLFRGFVYAIGASAILLSGWEIASQTMSEITLSVFANR